MGRAARHPLCVQGRGAEGTGGPCGYHCLYTGVCRCWREWAPQQCVLRFEHPWSLPGLSDVVGSTGLETPSAASEMGEPGRPRLGLCLLGTVLGPHLERSLEPRLLGTTLGTTLGTSFSSGSAGSFPCGRRAPGAILSCCAAGRSCRVPTAVGSRFKRDEAGQVPSSAMPRRWVWAAGMPAVTSCLQLTWLAAGPCALPASGGECVWGCREGINKLAERQDHKFRLFFLRLSNLCLSQGCKTAFYCCLL